MYSVIHIFKHALLYGIYTSMRIQDTQDTLCSSKDMKKQVAFYLFSTKRLSWEQTDWKIKERHCIRRSGYVEGFPNPCLILKRLFPSKGKKIKKKCVPFLGKMEIKKEKNRLEVERKPFSCSTQYFSIRAPPGFTRISPVQHQGQEKRDVVNEIAAETCDPRIPWQQFPLGLRSGCHQEPEWQVQIKAERMNLAPSARGWESAMSLSGSYYLAMLNSPEINRLTARCSKLKRCHQSVLRQGGGGWVQKTSENKMKLIKKKNQSHSM